MKAIIGGIIAIAVVSLMTWAIAPWFFLLWLSRNYNVDIKVSPKDTTKTVEVVEVETEHQKEPEIEIELEDYWRDEAVEESAKAEPIPVTEPEAEVETKEEPPVAEPAPVFPQCPANLQKMTLRELQLLCGEINKVRRSSISGYRNKKDKDKAEVIEKIEVFYQTI